MTALATTTGLHGHLEFCTRHLGDGQRIMHHGHAKLIRAENGLFLFIDLDSGIEMWLYADEVVRFTTDGAS